MHIELKKSYSLYVHIPFCRSKCDYCDFFSIPNHGLIPDSYIDALKNELTWQCSVYGIDSFRTVYIGGGTPSLLSAMQLKNLLSFLNKKMNGCQECTMEMNPETITEEKLMIARDCGINRLSVGIQSMNESALRAVHRHCSVYDTERALQIIKKVWKGRLNLDVIAGLPAQSSKDFLNSLQRVLDYTPDHVSLYTLTVEDGTLLAERIDNGLIWNSDLADEQWLLGKKQLESLGYVQYEVSNFCRQGMESLHNMAYWKQLDYIGIGSGATGTVYSFSAGECGLRWTNTTSLEEYISCWAETGCNSSVHDLEKKMWRTEERLDLATEEQEFFMMGLRTVSGVSTEDYKIRFRSLSPWYGDLFARLAPIRDKMKAHVCLNGDVYYAVSAPDFLFLNSVLLNLL